MCKVKDIKRTIKAIRGRAAGRAFDVIMCDLLSNAPLNE